MNRWLFLWRKLTRQLWVRASAYAIFGVAAALLAVVGAPWVPHDLAERLGGGGAVEGLLTILASSLLAVATFSVGAMVTAYTAVSAAATPRVSQLITADPQTQKSLATFVGAFLYAVVAVTAVNARYYAAEGRTILFLFSLAMVGLVAFRLLAWLDGWAAAEPGEPRCDRILAPGMAPDDMIEDVFGPIGRYSAGDVTVAVRLRKGLASLAFPAGEFAEAASTIAARELKRSKLEMRLSEDYERVAATAV